MPRSQRGASPLLLGLTRRLGRFNLPDRADLPSDNPRTPKPPTSADLDAAWDRRQKALQTLTVASELAARNPTEKTRAARLEAKRAFDEAEANFKDLAATAEAADAKDTARRHLGARQP